MEINILEGARGTGKSTVAFKLRQVTPETTLINFTGFHMDGLDGLIKVKEYYKAWISLFKGLSKHDSKYIFDRFYFSEAVFSQLYKEYDFSNTYSTLNCHLEHLATSGVKLNIFFLYIKDAEELKKRLMRDKVPFGKAEESVEQSLVQQAMYEALFDDLSRKHSNLTVHWIDTTSKTNDEVLGEIVNKKTV